MALHLNESGEVFIDGYPITNPDPRYADHSVRVGDVAEMFRKLREITSRLTTEPTRMDKKQADQLLEHLADIAAGLAPLVAALGDAAVEKGGDDEPKAETAAAKKKRLAAEKKAAAAKKKGDDDKPDKNDVRKALSACSEAVGREKTLAVFEQFEVEKLDELSASQYADVIEALGAIEKGEGNDDEGGDGW